MNGIVNEIKFHNSTKRETKQQLRTCVLFIFLTVSVTNVFYLYMYMSISNGIFPQSITPKFNHRKYLIANGYCVEFFSQIVLFTKPWRRQWQW